MSLVKKGPTIATRRTKIELHRSAVRGWPSGVYKDIAKDLIWVATITVKDLEAAQKEIVNLRREKA